MRTKRRFAVTASLLLGGALALSGCESKDEPAVEAAPPAQSAPAEPPQSEPEPVEEPAAPEPEPEEPAAPEGSAPIAGDSWSYAVPEAAGQINPDGPGLLFHDMRVGEHTDYYRIVFEFVGEGTPGWFGDWTDNPIEQGRGEPLPVEGADFLELFVTGIAIPMNDADYENYYDGPKTLNVGPIIVAEDGTFEGQTHFAVGMDKQREIQVGALQDPVRVVLDIRK